MTATLLSVFFPCVFLVLRSIGIAMEFPFQSIHLVEATRYATYIRWPAQYGATNTNNNKRTLKPNLFNNRSCCLFIYSFFARSSRCVLINLGDLRKSVVISFHFGLY